MPWRHRKRTARGRSGELSPAARTGVGRSGRMRRYSASSRVDAQPAVSHTSTSSRRSRSASRLAHMTAAGQSAAAPAAARVGPRRAERRRRGWSGDTLAEMSATDTEHAASRAGTSERHSRSAGRHAHMAPARQRTDTPRRAERHRSVRSGSTESGGGRRAVAVPSAAAEEIFSPSWSDS